MPDWPYGYILCNVFSEGAESVHLSERPAILIMISEDHWENYEISLQNVYGHMEPARNAHYMLCL